MSLPHSRKAYPGETEACDGHVSGFSFFGGVPRSILYDNTRIAVARIHGKRQRTRVFTSFPLPVRGPLPPRQGERQGQGRGDRHCRRNFLCRCGSGTSMISTRILKPAAPSDRNNCVANQGRTPRDRAALQRRNRLRRLDKRPGRVSSLSLVYRGTDYFPTRFGHCEVRCGYHEVVISCAAG